jgi:hypothetical protein
MANLVWAQKALAADCHPQSQVGCHYEPHRLVHQVFADLGIRPVAVGSWGLHLVAGPFCLRLSSFGVTHLAVGVVGRATWAALDVAAGCPGAAGQRAAHSWCSMMKLPGPLQMPSGAVRWSSR